MHENRIMKIIKTKQLLLRPFQPSDYLPLSHIFANEKVMALALKGRPYNSREFSELVAKKFAHHEQEPFGFHTVKLLNDNSIIGAIGIFPCPYLTGAAFDGHDDKEMILVLDQPFWNKGYANEIGEALIHYCLIDQGYVRLLALASPLNQGSLATLHKYGMHELTQIDVPDRGTRKVFMKRREDLR